MSGHQVEITLAGNRSNQNSLTIAGVELADSVADLRLTFDRPTGRPELALTLRPGGLVAHLADACITIDDATRDLLLRLGWVPPDVRTSGRPDGAADVSPVARSGWGNT